MKTFQIRDTENDAIVWTIDLENNTRTMTDPDSGRLVTMDLGQSDVHVDAALANYAAGYGMADTGLIADMVAPVLEVPAASDKYFTWDKDDVFQDGQDLVVAPGGAVKEFSPRISNALYATIGYGASAFVPMEIIANADAGLDPQRKAVARCVTLLRQARERRVATLVTTAGNWTGGYTSTLAAGAKWNGGASSDPVANIYAAVEASLLPVTGVAMSEPVFHAFVQNAQVQKYVASKSTVGPVPMKENASQFSALLGLPPFIVGTRKAKTGASTYGYIWGSNVALLHAESSAPSDGQSISTARTFRWNGANGGAKDGSMSGGFLVRSYFDPRKGPRGSMVFVVTHNDAEVMTSPFVGGLIIGATQ